MDTATIVPAEEVDSFATHLLAKLVNHGDSEVATILTLSGDLGAGKTTLVQALARTLGIIEVVTSPTFVVMKSYETTNEIFTTLVHIDAYRIDDVSELVPLNFDQVLNLPRTLVCIEWPERIESVLLPHVQTLVLTTNLDGSRTITYHGS